MLRGTEAALFATTVAVLGSVLFAPAGAAQTRGGAAEPVRLQVLVALGVPESATEPASSEPPQIDKDCLGISRRVPMRFKSLRKVLLERFDLAFGEVADLELPTSRHLRLLPIGIVNNDLHLQFDMPPMLNTRLRMVSGRSMIVGGEPHAGGHLIIEVIPTFRASGRPLGSPSGPQLYEVKGPGETPVKPEPR